MTYQKSVCKMIVQTSMVAS